MDIVIKCVFPRPFVWPTLELTSFRSVPLFLPQGSFQGTTLLTSAPRNSLCLHDSKLHVLQFGGAIGALGNHRMCTFVNNISNIGEWVCVYVCVWVGGTMRKGGLKNLGRPHPSWIHEPCSLYKANTNTQVRRKQETQASDYWLSLPALNLRKPLSSIANNNNSHQCTRCHAMHFQTWYLISTVTPGGRSHHLIKNEEIGAQSG